MSYTETRKQAVLEFLPAFLAMLCVLFTSRLALDQSIIPGLDAASVAIHGALAIYTYMSVRLIAGRAAALIIISFLCVSLYYASYQKYIHTHEPLIANDIASLSLWEVGAHYADTKFLAIAIIIGISATVASSNYWLTIRKRSLIWRALVASILVFTSAYLFSHSKSSAAKVLDSLGYTYYNWNMSGNFNTNGIFIHLLQTAVRNMPSAPSAEERAKFLSLASSPSDDTTKRMIVILCEACWYDRERFYPVFQPLVELGAVEMRGISPVFGGGTPNATIELISGLPVRNRAVTGVLYHEYRDLFASHTWTLPYQLQREGYITTSMHNYFGDFWYRSKVEPKLGFKEFYGIEDMPPDETEEKWPRDRVVYNFAKNFLEKNEGQPLFMHIATVHMHGPYPDKEGDGGESIYLDKARRTVSDTVEFINYVLKHDPETVIVLYADHKPALLGHFEGYTASKLGDVPVLLYDRDRERAVRFRSRATGKPFYCYTRYLSETYFGFRLPSAAFTEGACDHEDQGDYNQLAGSVPEWVYHATFFDTEPKAAGPSGANSNH